METSAKLNVNIEQAFYILTENILKNAERTNAALASASSGMDSTINSNNLVLTNKQGQNKFSSQCC